MRKMSWAMRWWRASGPSAAEASGVNGRGTNNASAFAKACARAS